MKYIFRKFSRRRILLLFIDVLLLYLSINMSSCLWTGDISYIQVYLLQVTGAVIIQLVVFMANGLYEINQDYTKPGIIFRVAGSVIIGSLIVLTIFFFLPGLKSPSRPIFLIDIVFKIACLYLGRKIYGEIFSKNVFHNILIIGANPASAEFVEQIKDQKKSGYNIIGFIDENKALGTHFKGYEVLGTSEKIREIVKKYKIDIIAVSLKQSERHENIIMSLISCLQSEVDVENVWEIYEEITGRVPFEYLNYSWFLDSKFGQNTIYRKIFKKILGRMLAFIILLVTSPVFIIALFLELLYPGKILFTQERIGKFGKKFKIIKFRTMKQKAEEATGPIWADKDDKRITKIGKILRILRIDELPQMINVLKGDMSLVGPRPEREHFIKKLQEEIPFYSYRLSVYPGITGWAQINRGYDSSVDDVKRKLEYDFYYIKNKSFTLDLVIILRTLKTIFTAKGK